VSEAVGNIMPLTAFCSACGCQFDIEHGKDIEITPCPTCGSHRKQFKPHAIKPWPPERDVVAHRLAQQIVNLTHAYNRELNEFWNRRDLRGAYACEERWRDEVEQACENANKYQAQVIRETREQLTEILALMPSPVVTVGKDGQIEPTQPRSQLGGSGKPDYPLTFLANESSGPGEGRVCVRDLIVAKEVLYNAHKPKETTNPASPILGGVFDHAPGCRFPDYGECTCKPEHAR